MNDDPFPAADDIRDESARLTAAAGQAGIPLKLFGGLAVWLTCPSVRDGPFARRYADMDFAVTASAAKRARSFLEAEGYVADQFFNRLHGATRLFYAAPDGRWSIDVIVDQLVMSHRLDLRTSLGGPGPTLPLADLLLSKLQVWEITRKDLGDALCLLADHPLDDDAKPAAIDGSVEAIGLDRIGRVLASDWGFCHTVERNLDKIRDLASEQPLPDSPFDVATQVERLRQAIDQAPKSVGWRARARVGEKVRWYETPEEVRH
jgi:hypothetical protein